MQDKIENFVPNGDRILVEGIMSPPTSEFLLPDAQKEKPTLGRVVLVGNGSMSEEGKKFSMPFQEKDTVMFPKRSGQEINIDGKTYIVLKSADIIGYFRGQ